MVIIAWTLLGITIVLIVAVWMLEFVAQFVKEVADTAVCAVRWFLGRRRLKIVASIHNDLREGGFALPKDDPDKAKLIAYKPWQPPLTRQNAHVFKGNSSTVFPEKCELSSEIEIESLRDILSISDTRPYDPVFAILTSDPSYPEPPPHATAEIEPPPSWMPWHPALEEPSFSPPLWSGWLKFLNNIVIAAHAEETEKVKAALARRNEILDKCERRNREVSELAIKAERAYAKAVSDREKDFADALDAYNKNVEAFVLAFAKEREKAKNIFESITIGGEEGFLNKIKFALGATRWPAYVSDECETRFDTTSGIVIHEHRFPDLAGATWIKQVGLKTGLSKKPANQREKKDAAARLHPSLCLRLAAEIARLDDEGILKAVAINGWAEYTDRTTGQKKRAYCASLFATKEQVLELNLSALDPLEAFLTLKGVSSRSLELIPVAPILRFDMNDPRFVDAKEVLSKMAADENLAMMDWEDFEHLCRELFERAFAGSGAEVRVTQASRDQGVDAIVFDPDPLRGGKIVIQAKRYTNLVDVSAVRDLYGAVINEGAVKGIIVTTSHFGPEAYTFAKDKPLTLLNGSELLSLLDKHGYRFRIDLSEAKSRL